MPSKLTILFCGCGFLASHVIPDILPHAERIVLVDRERVETENYNNAVLPKNYDRRFKVTALASLIQDLSSVKIDQVYENIKDADRLIELKEKYNVDFVFVSFDNVEARQIAREFALRTKTPTLFLGVTQNFFYIDWAEYIMLPTTVDEISRVNAEVARIKDVCTRLEFRPLGSFASAYAYFAFIRWLERGERNMFQGSFGNAISVSNIKR